MAIVHFFPNAIARSLIDNLGTRATGRAEWRDSSASAAGIVGSTLPVRAAFVSF